MAGPGPKNAITDVPGIKIGNAIDKAVKTGVTVIMPDTPMIVAGDVRGGGPGTRETDLLDSATLVDRADALVLAGGSSYGLGAADGVAAWLGARGRGFQLVPNEGVPPSPIVPSAILYDLANGGDKSWGDFPPYSTLGRKACEAVSENIMLGRAGAGYGAIAGNGTGGLGSASYITDDGYIIGAIVAVNSFGSVKMPTDNTDNAPYWSWPFELNNEFGGIRPATTSPAAADLPSDTKLALPRTNTTIAVIGVSVPAPQTDLTRIAIMAQDGLARAIRPVHAPTDGDVVFAISPGTTASQKTSPELDPLTLTRLGSIAADCLARAVARGVFEAEEQSS